MKRIWVLCISYFVFLGIFFQTRVLLAQIKVTGLENHTDLAQYIDQNVLIQYQKKSDQPIRFTKVKADLEKALNAKGYYRPRITYRREDEEDHLKIKPGPVYKINKINITGYEKSNSIVLKSGNILDAETVLDAQNQLYKKISKEHCFYHLFVSHEVLLDHNRHIADIKFIVAGEEDAKFGKTNFSGGNNIEREFLSYFLRYKEGECWNLNKIEATRTDLLETGLLSVANSDLPEKLPESKFVPVSFVLKTRAPRKIRLGVKYSTWEGPGVSANWRHNNYLGAGEEISILTQFSTLRQSLETSFRKPFFLSKKQSLNVSAILERRDTDAFEEMSLNLQSSLSRKLSIHWMGHLGVAFETSKITEHDAQENTFDLVSFPGGLNFDNRDDVLDSHQGLSFVFGTEPFFDAFGTSDAFLKNRIKGTSYFDLSTSTYDPVLASRVSVGSILGADASNIPASKRFYAGGGGSIRGFGFQEAGPINENGVPRGEQSLLETSIELRLKFTDHIGLVAFVDGGGVYADVFPDLEESFFIGAGMGMRYYTGFGPIRLDVAVPLNEKDNTDESFQIYISIGQAF